MKSAYSSSLGGSLANQTKARALGNHMIVADLHLMVLGQHKTAVNKLCLQWQKKKKSHSILNYPQKYPAAIECGA